ncbi:DHS-like NAD/FAD-binding domain-containing protein [Armillaria solidipes]|uniref:DHS-like NAD/FAD-binding domain-containing protein n=1 Tax=Armillaria solidipes TaxID=1076256 RepID=A0A2H3CQ82_9AGAR|nr:DHS-like NAD/FAD-binding domain-containing protein [Armillaria solidipes]
MASSVQSNTVQDFLDALFRGRKIVAITGAGLSAASGIPPFRGAGGAFEDNPSLVWMFYFSRTSSVTPNAAHLTLAVLCIPEILKILAPQGSFTLVTQNIDGLCEKAVQEVLQHRNPASGNDISPLFEMHVASMLEILKSCPALSSLAGEFFPETPSIPKEDLPHCSIHDGLLRPGVVWFEESPRHLRDFGILWTKLISGFAYEVSQHGGKVVVFNLNRSEGDDQADFLFLGPCEETLPGILFSSSP